MGGSERGMKRELSLVFQEYTPPHGWKHDSDFHYLRLTLPGFEAKDITIHMNKYGNLVVRGNRQVSEHKYISFEETFEVPKDAKLEDADGMFEDGQIYKVAIPKVPKELEQQHEIVMPKEITRDHDHDHDKKKDDASIHQYNNNNQKHDEPAASSKDYLKDIRADSSKNKKKYAFLIAILIALLVIAAILIVVLLRHK